MLLNFSFPTGHVCEPISSLFVGKEALSLAEGQDQDGWGAGRTVLQDQTPARSESLEATET